MSEKEIGQPPSLGTAMPLCGVEGAAIAREVLERVAGGDEAPFQICLKVHARDDVGKFVTLAGFAGTLYEEMRDAGT